MCDLSGLISPLFGIAGTAFGGWLGWFLARKLDRDKRKIRHLDDLADAVLNEVERIEGDQRPMSEIHEEVRNRLDHRSGFVRDHYKDQWNQVKNSWQDPIWQGKSFKGTGKEHQKKHFFLKALHEFRFAIIDLTTKT
jgi:hypothetical protein